MSGVVRTLLLLAAAALLAAAPASAQRRGGPVGVDRAEMERRLRAGFERFVREELGMDSIQARELGNAVLRFQEERLALQRREDALRRRFGSTRGRVRSAALPEADARAILQEMRAIQEAEADLFNREQDRLLELLTPSQLVSYYLLRDQMVEALRRARGP